ncbi:glycosyltransferase [Paenibacillus thiaminolyticus]|nr:glycosyltransferase [Paenibacillus thiaminolyticus]WII40446.1 glycosyltransferase [Paenibacillus thiaminolyticus]
MGCGALVLTDNTPEQSELFENGVHYLLYDSQEDMLDRARHVLDLIAPLRDKANRNRNNACSTPILAKAEQACRRT